MQIAWRGLVAAFALLAGCSTMPPAPTPTAVATATVVPSATPAPTATSTSTPQPTDTPRPSDTPMPTATPTAQPTATAIPTPEPPSPTVVEQTQPATGHVFPVQAAAGRISYGRVHHDYPATDIFCSIGSVFVAPIGGVIDYVSREDTWDPATDRPEDRGGLSIALVGDDGVRYYGSHLSKIGRGIEPGVRVEAGQALGLTGKSGNARFTPPHLHFGISHPTTPDDWQTRRGEVSPYPYLRAWQRGEDVTPDVPGVSE